MIRQRLLNKWLWLLVVLGLSGLVVSTAVAQTNSDLITAEIDRNSLTTDETLLLTITVSEYGGGAPELPALDGFTIVGSSTMTQMSMSNGSVSMQAVYEYRLQPYQTGTLTIPAVSVNANGTTYTTAPLTVEVAQGQGTPNIPNTAGDSDIIPPADELVGQDFFVEASVDNPTPYLGEQVTYYFRFYQAVDLAGQPSYEAPDFAGFWSQAETQQTSQLIEAAGRTYRVTELQTPLFPTLVGEQTINPARLTLPGSLFSRGQTMVTGSVVVKVQPHPVPTPADFKGAVGQFALTAELANPDQTAVDLNDALTLRVTVQGSGNMDTLPEPVWPEWDGWREFETTSNSSSRVENGRVVGQKTFEKVLIPLEAGERTLPALRYTYFDPAMETYQTATTEPLAMSVVGTASANQSAPTASVGEDALGNTAVVGESALATQIQPLKSVPTALQTSGAGAAATLLNAPLFWLMALLPALVLVGDWGWSAYQKRLAQDPVGLRRKRAKHTAVKRLKLAQQQTDSNTPALVAQALTAYLGDKLSQPTAGMTRPALAQTLREANMDAALIGRVQEILTLCEAARYAPQAEVELDLAAEAMTLIALLDAQS